jgi:hypothetical protein
MITPQHAPSSFDLSEQPWRAVCKFFPAVAARARRPMVDVGDQTPGDPIERGPLFQWVAAIVAEFVADRT